MLDSAALSMELERRTRGYMLVMGKDREQGMVKFDVGQWVCCVRGYPEKEALVFLLSGDLSI